VLASQADQVCDELWLMLQHSQPSGLFDMSTARAAKIPREPKGLPLLIHVEISECKLPGAGDFAENCAAVKKRFNHASSAAWQGMLGNRASNQQPEAETPENIYFELQFNTGRRVRTSQCFQVAPGVRTRVNAIISTRYMGEGTLYVAAKKKVGTQPSATDDLNMGPRQCIDHSAKARIKAWDGLFPDALEENVVPLKLEKGQTISFVYWLTDGDRRTERTKRLHRAFKIFFHP